MEEMDGQQQFRLFQKEIETAAALTEQTKLDLVLAIDMLKIEVEVLKRCRHSIFWGGEVMCSRAPACRSGGTSSQSV